MKEEDEIHWANFAAGKLNEDDKELYRRAKKKDLEARLSKVKEWNVVKVDQVLTGIPTEAEKKAMEAQKLNEKTEEDEVELKTTQQVSL